MFLDFLGREEEGRVVRWGVGEKSRIVVLGDLYYLGKRFESGWDRVVWVVTVVRVVGFCCCVEFV